MVIEKVSEAPGKYTPAPKVVLKGSKLYVTATAAPPAQQVEVMDKATVTETTITVYAEVNRLTSWQWLQIWVGRILFVLFAALIIYIKLK